MKISENVEMVKQIVKTYIAEDGKEFSNERDCKNYETNLQLEKQLEEIKPLLIHKDDFIPCNGSENYEGHLYRWYKVESQDQLNKVNELYNTGFEAANFPEFINIEQAEEFDFDSYGTTLTDCKEYVTRFFSEGFGIKVTFK